MRMRTLIATAAAVALLPFGGVSAADYTVVLTPGDAETIAHGIPMGTNVNYFGEVGENEYVPTGTCTKDPTTYCETVLVQLDNPVPANPDGSPAVAKRSLRVTVSWDEEVSDFDLVAFVSDAEGVRGAELGQSASWTYEAGSGEALTLLITTNTDTPTKYVLLELVYFAAATPPTTTLNF